MTPPFLLSCCGFSFALGHGLSYLHGFQHHLFMIVQQLVEILVFSVKKMSKHPSTPPSWRWWNSSWAISNPKRWCYESAVLNMPANLENSTMATGLEKVSFHPIPKKGNAKECSNDYIIALISHASKDMLKILQTRLRQYMNWELPDV